MGPVVMQGSGGPLWLCSIPCRAAKEGYSRIPYPRSDGLISLLTFLDTYTRGNRLAVTNATGVGPGQRCRSTFAVSVHRSTRKDILRLSS
ncbi:hypothetical protein PM082_006841 [Marasmius tenuissimus]|nr:hypothetical protein PM082_006841 [Marasmius tenuissimus]